MRRIPFLAAALVAGLAIALPAVAQIAPRTDRYDPSVSAPIADGILGLIGMVLLVIATIAAALTRLGGTMSRALDPIKKQFMAL